MGFVVALGGARVVVEADERAVMEEDELEVCGRPG